MTHLCDGPVLIEEKRAAEAAVERAEMLKKAPAPAPPPSLPPRSTKSNGAAKAADEKRQREVRVSSACICVRTLEPTLLLAHDFCSYTSLTKHAFGRANPSQVSEQAQKHAQMEREAAERQEKDRVRREAEDRARQEELDARAREDEKKQKEEEEVRRQEAERLAKERAESKRQGNYKAPERKKVWHYSHATTSPFGSVSSLLVFLTWTVPCRSHPPTSFPIHAVHHCQSAARSSGRHIR